MSAVTELGYVVFGVANLAEWREFATELLGLEAFEEPGESGRLYLRTDYWHHRIVLEQNPADDLLAAGLRVAGPQEFAALAQVLRDAGIAHEVADARRAAERRVLELMTLSDPAGNPLEIFHGPRLDPHKPFHPGRRMHGRFMTGDHGGVGHMILRHAGLDASYEFYRRLGMRGSLEYRIPTPDGGLFDILFMHCNQRDHTFAFGPPCRKSVNHLMLEVDNLDDVFMTHELVQASRYPVMISLGKHANDHMLSFYVASPSGFLIEIGYGGRPATHQSEYYVRDTYGHVFSERMGAAMSLDP
ncbi:MAG: VOC family protein [Proteobacteria bacterium]|nr:VOC family protein [Pseudomonadota bacterium]